MYERLGDFEKAFEFHEKYKTTRDSLFRSEQTRIINELNIKNKAENNLQLLKKQIQIYLETSKKWKNFKKLQKIFPTKN